MKDSLTEDKTSDDTDDTINLNSSEIKEEMNEIKSEVDDESSPDHNFPDLPLEVITTIEPSSFLTYPTLKNMSNGVLTHRNIFTEREREVLRIIVEKYSEIVNTRSRTRQVYLEKQIVWRNIVEEYNSTDNITSRSEKELKKCWDNMKYRGKLAEREDKNLDFKTESDQIKIDKVDKQIAYSMQCSIEKMLGVIKKEEEKETDKNENQRDDDNDSHDSNKGSWDEDHPVLKKARQESPKLSSILLGESLTNQQNTQQITQPTKKEKFNSFSLKKLNKLNSCVSVTNIPNPKKCKYENKATSSKNKRKPENYYENDYNNELSSDEELVNGYDTDYSQKK